MNLHQHHHLGLMERNPLKASYLNDAHMNLYIIRPNRCKEHKHKECECDYKGPSNGMEIAGAK